MRTVYAVSFESTSSGGVDWYAHEKDANARFNALLIECPDDEIQLFPFEVANRATAAQITDRADHLMWDRDYTATRSHNTGAGVFAGIAGTGELIETNEQQAAALMAAGKIVADDVPRQYVPAPGVTFDELRAILEPAA